MIPNIKSIGALGAVLIAAVALATAAPAQQWPARPVTLISPFFAGTTDDLVATTVLDQVGQQFGQQFILKNHARSRTAASRRRR